MTDVQLIDVKAVVRMTSLSKTTLYDLIAKQDFPAPIPLTSRRVAWSKSDVQEWIRRRMYGEGFMANELQVRVRGASEVAARG